MPTKLPDTLSEVLREAERLQLRPNVVTALSQISSGLSSLEMIGPSKFALADDILRGYVSRAMALVQAAADEPRVIGGARYGIDERFKD